MPKELIASAREKLAFRTIERSPLGPGQIRVKSLFGAAKHGTEMALYQGYANERGAYDSEYQIFTSDRSGVSYPQRLGNICVGEITEVAAGVTSHAVGDRVFRYSALADEHVWNAEEVWTLPSEVPWQAAVCLDPADFALGAVRDGNVRIGDTVAVFGMGAIGLMALQMAKIAGAHPVIALEPLPLRRDVATACGADLVLDPTVCDAGLEIKKATHKRGADVCIDYSGNHRALQAALRGVAYGGTVVAGAWPGSYPAGLDFGAEAHMNRPRIVFSRACSEPNPDYPRWNEQRIFDVCWQLLTSDRIVCEPIVQPVVAFEDLLEEYPKIAAHPEENVKLGVRFG